MKFDAYDRDASMTAEQRTEADEDNDFGNVMPSCIVAYDYYNKTLGIAYYKASSKELFISADLNELPPFNQWQTAALQIDADHVLLSSRASDVLHDHTGHDVVLQRSEIRPKSEFHAKNAIERLAMLSTSAQSVPAYRRAANISDGDAERLQARQRLLGTIDGSAILSLGCVHVLLCFLQTHHSRHIGPRNEALRMSVQSCRMFSLDKMMLLNADTFHALKIFEEGFKARSDVMPNKTDLTLFSMLDTCSTRQGKALLKHWMLTPSTDIELLRARHDFTERLLLPENMHVAEKLRKTLRKCQDMQHAMCFLRQGVYGSSKSSVWQTILSFVLNALKIAKLISTLIQAEDLSVCVDIMDAVECESLEDLASLINDVIDFDESDTEGRIVVKRLVDEELDEAKDTYEALSQALTSAELELAETVPPEFGDAVRCVYMPHMGFLITMPGSIDGSTESCPLSAVWQAEDWSTKFSSNNNVFFKSSYMSKLDEYYGDPYTAVTGREIELLHQLQLRVLEHCSVLIRASELLAELDCLLVFTSTAQKYNYVKPMMTTDIVLEIKDGRHPLLEQMIDILVPNDLICHGYEVSKAANLDEDMRQEYQTCEANLVLMTGANYSGKSVYIKQAALIVYMAHIGLYVPATSAVIGVTDRILSRLQSRDTLARAESAFVDDLQQINYAMEMLSPRSLLIIDEFGKASEGSAGAGLFVALVEHLVNPEHMRPRALLTTHFHEILHPSCLIRFDVGFVLKHMQVVIDRNARELQDQITYLFKVADGPSYSSFGINCAALGGMPQSILCRAEEILDLTTRGGSLGALSTVSPVHEPEQLKQSQRILESLLAWDLEGEPDETVRSKLCQIVARDERVDTVLQDILP